MQYVNENRALGLKDCLYIITKDLNTGKKSVFPIEEPTIPMYIEKEEYRNHNYVKEYYKKEEVDQKVIKYRDIPFEIAKEMGDEGKKFIKECIDTKSFNKLKQLNLVPYVCGQDFDIRIIYRHFWRKILGDSCPMNLRKGFLDIEADSLLSPGMPRPQNDPIDLVSFADAEEKVMYTFVLYGREFAPLDEAAYKRLSITREQHENFFKMRKEQEDFLVNYPDALEKELHEAFDEIYPGWDYRIFWYTNEAMMLVHLFQCIRKISPDALMIWNISFDIPYFIERAEALGLNPMDLFCDEEFLNRVCKFHKDTANFDIKNKSDHFEVSSKIVWVDQMINYASIRKGGEELRSFRLDYIARIESKAGGKFVFADVTTNFKFFPYLNLLKYILYNIKDVLCQYAIEENTMDMDNLYRNSFNNVCPYENCYMQSVVLRAVQYRLYDKQGLIPGANTNKIYLSIDRELHPEKYTEAARSKKTTDIEGALVGNTKLINHFGQKIYGKRTNFYFIYCIDMDMSSFYPSVIIIMNVSRTTLIFKIVLEATEYDVRGGAIPFHGVTDVELVPENTPDFEGDIAAEVFDNLHCGSILSLGRKFMNLPALSDIMDDLEEEFGELLEAV